MKENKIDNVKRFLFMLLGNYCIGLASAIFRTADFGTDPFTCMNLGISSHLPISYGTYQMLVNLVLFVPVIILARESFGAGCLVNMLGIGYISDFMVFVFGKLGLSIESIHASCRFGICCIVDTWIWMWRLYGVPYGSIPIRYDTANHRR